ncbi:hypothetical protein [Pararhodobacter marinus]|uniref:hypothetical protein n=1 Tax=Pararhodobacter marinus TaxID=2184063 RepID=UPI00351456E7
MTQKRRSLRAGKAKATLDQPLGIFEEALALLDGVGRPSSDTARLPALPLPSLLERCESVLEQKGPAGHSLLICADGLEALRPEWWHAHAGGIGVQILPASDDPDAVALQLEAFTRSAGRQGCHALTLAGLDMAPRLLRLFDTVRLLSWHPWSSFGVAPRAVTLEEHCHLTGALIDRFEGVPTVKIEDFGPLPARQAAGIAAAFGLTLPARAASSRPAPDRMPPPVDLEGGPRYRQLCERLDYAPATVPLPPERPGTARRPLTLDALERRAGQDDGGRTASRSGPRARISWLRPRLDRLGLPAPITDEAGLEELVGLLDRCLAQTDFREELDPLVETLPPGMASLLLLLAAAHWTRMGESLIAMGLASEAIDVAPAAMPVLHQLGASLYADLGQSRHAFHLSAGPLLEPGFLSDPHRQALLRLLYGESLKPGGEHGQDLLITYLQAHPPGPAEGRKRRLVEIGTTREAVPGQGSTKQLASICAGLGLDFVTVDMDPENGRRARQMFRRNGHSFQAVSGKGEDYLAQTDEPLDYVFLDAYDFDHGNHSEWRQSRYSQFLGDRISDAACHQMHLECAQALVEKLAPDGLICFDDTWRDEVGEWTAKGKTAMPYLLAHGFELIEARNRAALLRRKGGG